jgi:hypothetical protein
VAGSASPPVLIGQFAKLCDLDYWNGMVLNVAHCMLLARTEFRHVLSRALSGTSA